MKELVAEVKTLVVYRVCEKCNDGTMHIDYRYPVLSSYPEQYCHVCNKCGHAEYFITKYPHNRIIQIEPLRELKDDER